MAWWVTSAFVGNLLRKLWWTLLATTSGFNVIFGLTSRLIERDFMAGEETKEVTKNPEFSCQGLAFTARGSTLDPSSLFLSAVSSHGTGT